MEVKSRFAVKGPPRTSEKMVLGRVFLTACRTGEGMKHRMGSSAMVETDMADIADAMLEREDEGERTPRELVSVPGLGVVRADGAGLATPLPFLVVVFLDDGVGVGGVGVEGRLGVKGPS